MFRPLKRYKQALTEDRCKDILTTTLRGTLSMIGDDGYPYGLTLNHYFDQDGCLYFHSGRVGHKIDAILKNDKVCYTVITDGVKEDNSWALTFESVVVFGSIEIIEDSQQTEKIARLLSKKFTLDNDYVDNEIEKFLSATILLKLTPQHISGKRVNEN